MTLITLATNSNFDAVETLWIQLNGMVYGSGEEPICDSRYDAAIIRFLSKVPSVVGLSISGHVLREVVIDYVLVHKGKELKKLYISQAGSSHCLGRLR
jgi:hypothetical protein